MNRDKLIAIARELGDVLEDIPAPEAATVLSMLCGVVFARHEFAGQPIDEIVKVHASQVPKYIPLFRRLRTS